MLKHMLVSVHVPDCHFGQELVPSGSIVILCMWVFFCSGLHACVYVRKSMHSSLVLVL